MSSLTSGRQSPFRRQPSTNSPSPLRASTPSSSPTKPSLLSPARGGATTSHAGDALLNTSHGHNSRHGTPQRGESNLPARDAQILASGTSALSNRAESPVRRLPNHIASPAGSVMHSPLDRSSIPASPSTQILVGHDDTFQTQTPATAPIRQPVFTNNTKTAPNRAPQLPKNNGVYNNIPAPLLRSLRESFEVLDPNATGSLNSTSLPPVLDQIGLPVDSKTLNSFFPPGQSPNINLASYLDMLCGPISQLSSQDELAAAFGAFDVDDSGQIDVQELKQALLCTVPEPGEMNPGARLAEADIDAILQDFTGRRAFGARNTTANRGATVPRGDVFKWKEFVNSVNGAGADSRAEVVAA